MTREEQIIGASHNYGKMLNEEAVFDYEDMKCAFKEGAMWADKHPVNVYHNASEKPKENSKIVIVDTKDKLWDIDYVSDDFDGYGLHGWECCKVHYDLKIWAYKSDLLPKGGER